MKKYNTTYYLLFVLLVMGAFAAMAQNNYGLSILGVVAFSFSLLFVIQLIPFLTKKESWSIWTFLELISLSILALLLGLRVFYIRLAFAEWMFGMSGMLLLVVHIKKIKDMYRLMSSKKNALNWFMVSFHLSIILYVLSLTLVPFIPSLSEPIGVVAFASLTIFVASGFLKREFIVDGEKISSFKLVAQLKDRSIVLLALFLAFTFYTGFTKIGVLPKMYSNEYPQVYFELVNRAELGKDQSVNGKLKHEEFKETYDQFIKRNKPQ